MKIDSHGIVFSIWKYFILFAFGILFMLGFLQFSLIRPYYRNNKIAAVSRVSDMIEQFVLSGGKSENDFRQAFQLTVDNNACISIYNDAGKMIYQADSLGSGCVFNMPASSYIESGGVNMQDGTALKNAVIQNNGEWSLNLMNSRTQQEMIVYGKRYAVNLGNYYLFVNSPLEPVDSIITFFSRQYLLYGVIVVALASLISILISRRLTKPIVKMRSEAMKLAHADYSAQFEGGGFTETRALADTLNSANKRLSRIDELRKDLIANISHDIKTPLTSIRAYAEMIRDISGDRPEKREQHLNVIIDEADYLDHLVSDMNELSKMQSGNYELRRGNFDMSEKIREIVRLYQVMIDEGGLTVHIDVPETLTVYADEIKIGQVISNFLSNAIKHTPAGKNIWISAKREADEETVMVEVRDEGEGISEEDMPNIWDRYQKSSRSFSRSMTNTGLGLAIVKAILDTHGSRYGVVSEPDHGSTFWFELGVPVLSEDEDA
ncbi:MAG: HAMP domain-containing histidine kinase [Solobacterium sp.]|nr:HAMP domain-containing histidine kinase [Erysipelotrichaceae bacterium]MBQ9152332.1 HAMP domain-containing histidine kinase [Solobacterium sp.]